MLQQDRGDEAVQQFRDALSAAPGNAQYRLALGLALAKANHPAEASVYLNALLKRDQENALANLGEARMAAAQGNTTDAMKLYRRAIDGAWPPGQEKSRTQARFELASLLEKPVGARRQPMSFGTCSRRTIGMRRPMRVLARMSLRWRIIRPLGMISRRLSSGIHQTRLSKQQLDFASGSGAGSERAGVENSRTLPEEQRTAAGRGDALR